MWEAVEASTRKVGMGKTERRRKERRSRREERRKGKRQKLEK